MSFDLPVPIWAHDILPDGSSVTVKSPDMPLAPETVYRWLHFDLATPHLREWMTQSLPAGAVRALLAVKTRPRVEAMEDSVLLVLRGINHNEGFEQSDMVSLRIWVTPSQVVTVRRQRVFAVDEQHKAIMNGDAPTSQSRLVARLTEALVNRIEALTLELDDIGDTMEDGVYEDEVPAPADLAPMRRKVIKLRRHVGPLSDTLADLSHISSGLFPSIAQSRLRETANRCQRSLEELTEVKDRLTAMADHLDLQQTARLERNSYRLSVAAAIFLPLSFLTGLFGVNVAGMPGTDWPWAFATLSGGMVVLGVLCYIVFRWIRLF